MWQSCCDYQTGKQGSVQQCQHIRGARLPSSSLIYLPALRAGLINLKTPLPRTRTLTITNITLKSFCDLLILQFDLLPLRTKQDLLSPDHSAKPKWIFPKAQLNKINMNFQKANIKSQHLLCATHDDMLPFLKWVTLSNTEISALKYANLICQIKPITVSKHPI